VKIEGSKFLVIGDAGFIGSFVVAELLNHPVWKVFVFDDSFGAAQLHSGEPTGSTVRPLRKRARAATDVVLIPVVAHAGPGRVADIGAAVLHGDASAAAPGNLVVYQGKGDGGRSPFSGCECPRRYL
jgi:nucleoside-diphosphate-sugar epimerase